MRVLKGNAVDAEAKPGTAAKGALPAVPGALELTLTVALTIVLAVALVAVGAGIYPAAVVAR